MSSSYASDMTSGKLFSYHFCMDAEKGRYQASKSSGCQMDMQTLDDIIGMKEDICS
jgi:hypothetical protein